MRGPRSEKVALSNKDLVVQVRHEARALLVCVRHTVYSSGEAFMLSGVTPAASSHSQLANCVKKIKNIRTFHMFAYSPFARNPYDVADARIDRGARAVSRSAYVQPLSVLAQPAAS